MGEDKFSVYDIIFCDLLIAYLSTKKVNFYDTTDVQQFLDDEWRLSESA